MIPEKYFTQAQAAAEFIYWNTREGNRILTNQEICCKFKLPGRVLRLVLQELVALEIREKRRHLIQHQNFSFANGKLSRRIRSLLYCP